MPSPSPVHHADGEAPPPKTALDERRPFLLAMPEQTVERQPKVDASVAAEIVLGSAPQIAHHKAAIVAQFGAAAGTTIDELPMVALATKQADVELSAAAVNGDLGPMEADLRAEHTLLFTDAQSLANRKLLDPQRLEAARGTLSYRQLIHSTLVLVALLREHWPAIADQTPIKAADLDRTEEKATRMLTTLGEREQGATRVPAAELRLRALTDLVTRYDEVRRMLTYLRWHEGDVDEIAPSLYARRAVGRRAQDDASATTTPAATAPAATTPAAPVAPAASPTASPTGAPASPFVS
jgi:hypothetical protein